MHTDRTFVEIDIDAIRHNIQIAKERLCDAKLMCLVKANAYGHGAVEIVKFCNDLIDWLGVATVDEGIELRKNKIKLPILVVGDVAKSRYPDALDKDLQLTVHSYEGAKSLSDFCLATARRAKVHIAVDSGMGRIGFLPSQLDMAIKASKLKGLEIKGIFSHFAKADEKDRSYTVMQKHTFDSFVTSMQLSGVDIGLRHIANSASILSRQDCNYDIVRMGIMMYGLAPSKQIDCNDLRPAMSWYSHIVQIKTLPKGQSVSYGGEYVTSHDTTVATVAVGYGDGYPRALSNKGYMLVGGQKANIIGRICMDQTMIDITHIEGVRAGDLVTLMGKDGEEYISADDIATLASTINYEIVCGISNRVERKYICRNSQQFDG